MSETGFQDKGIRDETACWLVWKRLSTHERFLGQQGVVLVSQISSSCGVNSCLLTFFACSRIVLNNSHTRKASSIRASCSELEPPLFSYSLDGERMGRSFSEGV
jgi:hypothetical protein